jgi:hypothetical protein
MMGAIMTHREAARNQSAGASEALLEWRSKPLDRVVIR